MIEFARLDVRDNEFVRVIAKDGKSYLLQDETNDNALCLTNGEFRFADFTDGSEPFDGLIALFDDEGLAPLSYNPDRQYGGDVLNYMLLPYLWRAGMPLDFIGVNYTAALDNQFTSYVLNGRGGFVRECIDENYGSRDVHTLSVNVDGDGLRIISSMIGAYNTNIGGNAADVLRCDLTPLRDGDFTTDLVQDDIKCIVVPFYSEGRLQVNEGGAIAVMNAFLSMAVLAYAGIPIKALIGRDFDWPIGCD